MTPEPRQFLRSLGPPQLVQPFPLMSEKEAFLPPWVLGKFKEMTLLKRGPAMAPSSAKDVPGALTWH